MIPSLGARLPSFASQSLLLEFASVSNARLDGIYVSLKPGAPSSWVGVIFVRKGPYSPAVLRFHIAFPPEYPSLPPLVTFSTDVFHPLLTPLTTYTYTTSGTDTDTISASDEERLPPGVFSLRHGFPQLFGRTKKSATNSRNVSDSTQGMRSPVSASAPKDVSTPGLQKEGKQSSGTAQSNRPVCAVEILRYIQSTFSDEAVLDSIPLDAAANPGAYHAWRTYRGDNLITNSPTSGDPRQKADVMASSVGRTRRPGEWNWDGVWEERVKKGIRASLSEPSLFAGGPDEIQFLDMDEDSLMRARREIEASAISIQ